MNYDFPTIRHLDEVLKVVKGMKEFTVLKRGPYTVVSYQVAMPETFPDVKGFFGAARRECRGLIFDKDGKIIRRAYHKFFNMNERNETLEKKIDLSRPHVVLEKLDGSMVTPLILNRDTSKEFNRRVCWATKLGITGVAMEADAFVQKSNIRYNDFAIMCDAAAMTPIFEWCSRSNKIVLDYPEDQLILTGIRFYKTGSYIQYDQMVRIAENWGIPFVQRMDIKDIHDVSGMEGIEGIVIRFDDGHMVKVKCDWYVLRHKAKEAIKQEKNVISMIINDQVDDVIPMLAEAEAERLRKFGVDFWVGVWQYAEELTQMIHRMKNSHSRKEFALLYDKNIDKVKRSIIFGFYNHDDVDRHEVKDRVIENIAKNLGSNPRVENVRHLWGGKRWSDYA